MSLLHLILNLFVYFYLMVDNCLNFYFLQWRLQLHLLELLAWHFGRTDLGTFIFSVDSSGQQVLDRAITLFSRCLELHLKAGALPRTNLYKHVVLWLDFDLLVRHLAYIL